MSFQVTLNIPEKAVYLLLVIALACVAVIGVSAYDSSVPDPGHGGDTILVEVNGEEKTLQKAIDDLDLVRPSWNYEPKWTPLDKSIGQLPSSASTQSYDMPSDVPGDATEVLIYVQSYSGGASQVTAKYDIYTQEGSTKYLKRHYLRCYYQSAISYSSDNFWLPVTSDRKIHVSLDLNIGTVNRGAAMRILGYRTGIGSLE